MAVEIIMPKLGVDMQEGEIIEWKKQAVSYTHLTLPTILLV